MAREVPDHLNLGCGLTTPAGWLNVDGSLQVVLARMPWLKKLLVAARVMSRRQAEIPWNPEVMRLDLTRPLPFADGSFAAIYSSHLLEHLYHDQALSLLKECHRVLRCGSVCRAVVPDLEALASRYLKEKAAAEADAGTRFMESMLVHDKGPRRGPLSLYFRLTAFHQHKWMYDANSLRQLFESAGFRSVRQADYLDSRIGRIAEVEDAGRILNGEGLAVEGAKE